MIDQNTEPDFSAGWEAHRQAEAELSKTVKINRRQVGEIVTADLIEKYDHYIRHFSFKPKSIKKLRDVLAGWYLDASEMKILDEAIKLGPLPDDPLEIFKQEDFNNV